MVDGWTAWLVQYGYWFLFFVLMTELIAFGIPTEAFMSYAGYLIYQGKLGWGGAIFSAGLGTACGITLAYWFGRRLGLPFFQKYGAKVHLGPERLEKTSQWFQRYGYHLLVFAYFIPGIRHMTGYFSGITKIPFRLFAVYAYPGAFLWVGTFISLGRLLGPQWLPFHDALKRYLLIGGMVLALLLTLLFLYRNYRGQLFFTLWTTFRQLGSSRALRRVRLLLLSLFVASVTLFVSAFHLIREYYANEFSQFDLIIRYIIFSLFPGRWMNLIHNIYLLASPQVFFPVMALVWLVIMWKGKNRRLEGGFLLYVLVGGECLEEVLRRIIGHFAPAQVQPVWPPYPFPSEQSMMVLIAYGFIAYLAVRYTRRLWLRSFAFSLVVALALLVGCNRIYYGIQEPSDVLAGYIFGATWLSVNILLFEILHLMQRVQQFLSR